MSFVFAVPEMVAATASDLASLGAALSEATAAAAIPTTQVLAAAADEVSAASRSCSVRTAKNFKRSAPRHRRFMTGSCGP